MKLRNYYQMVLAVSLLVTALSCRDAKKVETQSLLTDSVAVESNIEDHYLPDTMLSMSKTSNISYFNYLFNNYTLRCQADVVRLIHATSSDHCSYNGNHLILDIIQCNHRLLSSFYKPLIILCNLWTSSYRG